MRYFTDDGVEITLAAMTDAYHTETAYFFWKRGEATNIDCLSIWLRGGYRAPYTMVSGVRELLGHLERFYFTEEHLAKIAARTFPDGSPKYEPAFIDFLRNAEPWCRITAIPDGDFAYPGPVMNIIGPRWFIKRLGTSVTNHLRNLSSPMTKAVRIRDAAGPLKVWSKGAAVPNPEPRAYVLGGEMRRTNDLLGVTTSIDTLIAGFDGTSNEAAEQIEDSIQAGGTVDHYTQMAGPFTAEGKTRAMLREQARRYAEVRPNYGAFLPDTSKDARRNIDDLIEILLDLKANGNGRGYKVRLDSGNLASLYRYTREKLDAAGLPDVGVFLSGGIKARAILSLLRQGVPLKGLTLMVGEYLKHRMELSNHGDKGEDEVNVEFIDKLSAITLAGSGSSSTWAGRMKLAEGKLAYPGILERLRMLDRDGRTIGDVTVDITTFNVPEDGVLAEPLTSIWRYTKPDGTAVNRDYTFPAGTRFLRPMQLVWDNENKPLSRGVVNPGFWSLASLKDFTATNLARLPEWFRDPSGDRDNYGSGVEQGLHTRATLLAEADEISTEYLETL